MGLSLGTVRMGLGDLYTDALKQIFPEPASPIEESSKEKKE